MTFLRLQSWEVVTHHSFSQENVVSLGISFDFWRKTIKRSAHWGKAVIGNIGCHVIINVILKNAHCSLRSVRSVYFLTDVSFEPHAWQLHANHHVNFLSQFLGLVAHMVITSLQVRVRRALMVDWHPPSAAFKNSLWPFATETAWNGQPTAKHWVYS